MTPPAFLTTAKTEPSFKSFGDFPVKVKGGENLPT